MLDIWIKDCRLIQGDCIDTMKQLIKEGVKVDLILTDPPYAITDAEWDNIIPFAPMWECIKSLRKEGVPTVLFGVQPFSSKLVMSNIKEYKHNWIWNKDICGAFALAKKRPMIVTEDLLVFGEKGKKVNYYPIMVEANIKLKPNKGSSSSDVAKVASGVAKSDPNYDGSKRYPKNIINISKYKNECNQNKRVHPTQKPVELLEYIIKTYTKEGDTVLDFTAGSFSTAIACIRTGRKFIGIELDNIYYNIGLERVQSGYEEVSNGNCKNN